MIKLAVSGAGGRMGKTITELALKNKSDFQLAALLERKDHPQAGEAVEGVSVSTDNQSIKGCDCLIEFTLPEGTMNNLKACIDHGVKMVIGTTGLNKEQEEEIRKASGKIAVVYASNMSIGVNTLFKMIEIAGGSLQGIEDISIGETHHVHKKDKPSGTAKTMKKIADAASGKEARFDEGKIKREDEVIGYHEITFETEFDTLKIIHNAKDRSMFASGALQAAKFLKDKDTGLYNMQDVLGLK